MDLKAYLVFSLFFLTFAQYILARVLIVSRYAVTVVNGRLGVADCAGISRAFNTVVRRAARVGIGPACCEPKK